MRDFVAYIQGLVKGGERVKAALGIIVTDSQLHDLEDLMAYTKDLARAITDGKFPRTVFTTVGVGADVDETRLSELMHDATPEDYEGREIWCYALADHVGELPELVSHLVDTNVPAFWGGATVSDDRGNTVLTFADMVPAVIEFTVPRNARSFTLTGDGQNHVQSLVGLPAHGRDRDRDDDH